MVDKNTVLMAILGLLFFFCAIMMIIDNTKQRHTRQTNPLLAQLTKEGFDATTDIQAKIDTMSDDELKAFIGTVKKRLGVEANMDQYVLKSALPAAGPRVDMSKYVLKSSIPAEKTCQPQKDLDYSQYLRKSTIPPPTKCAPCISPKVKVSAGLCKKCPKCPDPPTPPPCPVVECPEPKPCPVVECPKCSEIKYIKVPTVITRTIKVDTDNNVIGEEVTKNDSNDNTLIDKLRNTLANNSNNNNNTEEETPSTTSTTATTSTKAEDNYTIPSTTRAENKQKAEQCNVIGLNSEFRKYGIYGMG